MEYVASAPTVRKYTWNSYCFSPVCRIEQCLLVAQNATFEWREARNYTPLMPFVLYAFYLNISTAAVFISKTNYLCKCDGSHKQSSPTVNTHCKDQTIWAFQNGTRLDSLYFQQDSCRAAPVRAARLFVAEQIARLWCPGKGLLN